MLISLPFIAFIEQVTFFWIFPDLTVRMLAISILVVIAAAFSLGILLGERKNTALPGALLTFGMTAQLIIMAVRIPAVIINPESGLFLNTGPVQSWAVLFWAITSSVWPTGFALLIAHRHRLSEQERTKEKTVLLQELYHRTKNNMHVIISMMEWQIAVLKNPDLAVILKEIQNRIHSMALVHQKLYQSENLSHISLKEYITDLADSLRANYAVYPDKIDFRYDLDDVYVLIDTAIPCGLILNELITNSIKYAFPGDGNGRIAITLGKSGNTITISVCDDGIGLPDGFDPGSEKYFGLQVVRLLAEKQLYGSFEITSKPGVRSTICFSDDRYSVRV